MSTSKNKFTILLVDDEPRITSSLRALFRRNYNVHTANSGKEALAVLEKHSIDVLVSDQRMPEMQGSELLAIVSRKYPQTMRILLTGFMDRQAIVDSINDGEVYRFVNKPWDIDDIRKTVADAADASTLPIETSENSVSIKDIASAIEGKAILVLEKNQETRNLIRKYCSQHKVMNYSTQNVEQMISAVETRENIGVVIIELTREASTKNIQTINLLKQARPELVVITITEEYDADIAVELINQGQVFKYLARPIDSESLYKSIHKAFHRHLLLKDNEGIQQRYKVEKNKGRIVSGLQGLFGKLLGTAS